MGFIIPVLSNTVRGMCQRVLVQSNILCKGLGTSLPTSWGCGQEKWHPHRKGPYAVAILYHCFYYFTLPFCWVFLADLSQLARASSSPVSDPFQALLSPSVW